MAGMGEVPFNKVARLEPASGVVSRDISPVLLHMPLNMTRLDGVSGDVMAWNVMADIRGVWWLRRC